jgi:hypothetical protein
MSHSNTFRARVRRSILENVSENGCIDTLAHDIACTGSRGDGIVNRGTFTMHHQGDLCNTDPNYQLFLDRDGRDDNLMGTSRWEQTS